MFIRLQNARYMQYLCAITGMYKRKYHILSYEEIVGVWVQTIPDSLAEISFKLMT